MSASPASFVISTNIMPNSRIYRHSPDALGLSPFHFHRLFSSWVGVTPKDFLQCLTLARVKEMFHNGKAFCTRPSIPVFRAGPAARFVRESRKRLAGRNEIRRRGMDHHCWFRSESVWNLLSSPKARAGFAIWRLFKTETRSQRGPNFRTNGQMHSCIATIPLRKKSFSQIFARKSNEESVRRCALSCVALHFRCAFGARSCRFRRDRSRLMAACGSRRQTHRRPRRWQRRGCEPAGLFNSVSSRDSRDGRRLVIIVGAKSESARS